MRSVLMPMMRHLLNLQAMQSLLFWSTVQSWRNEMLEEHFWGRIIITIHSWGQVMSGQHSCGHNVRVSPKCSRAVGGKVTIKRPSDQDPTVSNDWTFGTLTLGAIVSPHRSNILSWRPIITSPTFILISTDNVTSSAVQCYLYFHAGCLGPY